MKHQEETKAFALLWKHISRDKEVEDNSYRPSDEFFDGTTIDQTKLTSPNKIFDYPVDYSRYKNPNNDELFDIKNIKKFAGILNYIFENSQQKFNINELEFHFTGENDLKSDQNEARQDILNLFYFDDTDKQYQVAPKIDSFFGVTFKNIKIKPLAYSIRSGLINRMNDHLESFTFEGYDEQFKKWDILDERVYIKELIPAGGICNFFVHSSDEYYSSFRIRQTEPSLNGLWGFSISAFDIYGDISQNLDKKKC